MLSINTLSYTEKLKADETIIAHRLLSRLDSKNIQYATNYDPSGNETYKGSIFDLVLLDDQRTVILGIIQFKNNRQSRDLSAKVKKYKTSNIAIHVCDNLDKLEECYDFIDSVFIELEQVRENRRSTGVTEEETPIFRRLDQRNSVIPLTFVKNDRDRAEEKELINKNNILVRICIELKKHNLYKNVNINASLFEIELIKDKTVIAYILLKKNDGFTNLATYNCMTMQHVRGVINFCRKQIDEYDRKKKLSVQKPAVYIAPTAPVVEIVDNEVLRSNRFVKTHELLKELSKEKNIRVLPNDKTLQIAVIKRGENPITRLVKFDNSVVNKKISSVFECKTDNDIKRAIDFCIR